MRPREPRKLSLNRETVRELDDRQLDAVKGAAISVNGCWTPVIYTLPLNHCIAFSGGKLC